MVSKSHGTDHQHVYSRAIANSIKNVDSSMNDIVIRTYSGMAQAVAAGVDALHESDILGCVAGDDTIMLVARTPEAAARICNSIKEMLARV